MVEDGFRFFDGDSDPSFRAQGPPLLHHCFKTLEQIQVARMEIWKEIVFHEIYLPATTVRLFDEDGNFCGMKHSNAQDASALSMLGSLHDQHHLDALMYVPVTSAFNCPLTGIATSTKHPRVVPMVSMPSASILDTSMEVPVISATKYISCDRHCNPCQTSLGCIGGVNTFNKHFGLHPCSSSY